MCAGEDGNYVPVDFDCSPPPCKYVCNGLANCFCFSCYCACKPPCKVLDCCAKCCELCFKKCCPKWCWPDGLDANAIHPAPRDQKMSEPQGPSHDSPSRVAMGEEPPAENKEESPMEYIDQEVVIQKTSVHQQKILIKTLNKELETIASVQERLVIIDRYYKRALAYKYWTVIKYTQELRAKESADKYITQLDEKTPPKAILMTNGSPPAPLERSRTPLDLPKIFGAG